MTRDAMSGNSRDENDWTGWIIPGGALLIAGVLLVWTLWPRGSEPATAPASAGPTPEASIPDPHIVVSPGGTFSFGYENGAIVIRQVSNPAGELGRAPIPAAQQPTASGDFTGSNRSGNAMFALACPSNVRGIEPRMIFGFTTTPPVTYTGPPAAGGSAPDGMWLFVLDPGALGANDQLDVSSGGSSGNRSDVRISGKILIEAATNGTAQPSGCWVVL